jgi:hypothetical protein
MTFAPKKISPSPGTQGESRVGPDARSAGPMQLHTETKRDGPIKEPPRFAFNGFRWARLHSVQ